ncbi:MAG: tetratricopeptide repeat protein [Deltaproteobacteria bacterium]|jgi:tetratricopeptide (TPR) repeat protein|nr:tetratricopeptide repeat protein [Deltaproteobacteria bacterium]
MSNDLVTISDYESQLAPKVSMNLPPGLDPAKRIVGTRVESFEAKIISSLMESLGITKLAEPISSKDVLNPLSFPESITYHIILELNPIAQSQEMLQAPSEGEANKPKYPLVISRRLAKKALGAPDEVHKAVKDELKTIFALAQDYVLVLYPEKSQDPKSLFSQVEDLGLPYKLGGFLPHRYPKCFHDNGTFGAGNLYVFQRIGTAPVAMPFGISVSPKGINGIRDFLETEGDTSPKAAQDQSGAINTKALLTEVKELTLLGKYQEALPKLYELIYLAPTEYRLRQNLAVIYTMLGDNDKAITILQGILAEDPLNRQVKEKLARIHLFTKNYQGLRAFLPELMILKNVDQKVQDSWSEIRDALVELESPIEPSFNQLPQFLQAPSPTTTA